MAECLSDLIAALSAATGPSRELDAEIAVAVFGFQYAGHGYLRAPSGMFHYHRDIPPFSASLDAITGALEQRWPDYRINAGWAADYAGVELFAEAPHFAAADARSLALALCLAAARLALAESDAR